MCEYASRGKGVPNPDTDTRDHGGMHARVRIKRDGYTDKIADRGMDTDNAGKTEGCMPGHA
jgi:hypothetical protein